MVTKSAEQRAPLHGFVIVCLLYQGAEEAGTNEKQTMNSCIVHVLHSLPWAGSVL